MENLNKNFFLFSSALVFAILAFGFVMIVTRADDCNPVGNGEPTCTAAFLGKKYSNPWDPTIYWICNTVGKATVGSCQGTFQGWSAKTKACVDWTAWEWFPACSV